jgi:uncharacterized membrane protein
MQQNYGTHSRVTPERIATSLGWFSVGLGLAEVVAPGTVANLIGVNHKPTTKKLLRAYGVRELAAGVGILTRPRQTGWIWSRVAGDMLDLASLGSAMQDRHTNKLRLGTATAAVLGVTALDVICGQQFTKTNGAASNGHAKEDPSKKVIRTIVVDRSPEEAYRFWRNFENLPKLMTYLESVRTLDNRRTHWTAVGPAGNTIEWDAELVTDEPNQTIAWRSINATHFKNAGTVRFETAPGNRGTLVRVEMKYEPVGGSLPSIVNKMLGADLGRRLEHDLRNFKQVLEVGEVTKSDASIHPGMHAAQPPASVPA